MGEDDHASQAVREDAEVELGMSGRVLDIRLSSPLLTFSLT